MDKPISKSIRRKNKIGKWLRIGGLLLLTVVVFAFIKNSLKTSLGKSDLIYAVVEKGEIENTISATGIVIPAFERQINAPANTEIKQLVEKIGNKVQSGDIIIRLEEELIRLAYESLHDELEVRKNKITLLKLEYDKNLKDLEYAQQIKGLEIENYTAQLTNVERLKSIGGETQEEVTQAKLTLQRAELEKKQLENELNFKKEALVSNRRNLELEVLIQEKKLTELTKKLKETDVKAPQAGVITWMNEKIGLQVNEGDPLVRLADLASFRIEAVCSDRYTNLVQVGMPVRIRINKITLNGKISSVLPAIKNNNITFLVELEKGNHKALVPNMNVEVFIISERREQVLRVKNGPAIKGAKRQNVFVLNGDKAIKKTVNIGLQNADYVEIKAGEVKAGDKVILTDMEPYLHLNEIDIKQETN